jgi:hypothetical protein
MVRSVNPKAKAVQNHKVLRAIAMRPESHSRLVALRLQTNYQRIAYLHKKIPVMNNHGDFLFNQVTATN